MAGKMVKVVEGELYELCSPVSCTVKLDEDSSRGLWCLVAEPNVPLCFVAPAAEVWVSDEDAVVTYILR